MTDSGDVRELNRFAVRAMAQGDPRAACDALERALELDRRELAVWLNLAGARRALGEPEAALAAVEGALEIEPRSFPALLMKASLLERMGEAKRAAAAYGVALTQAPPEERLDGPTLRALRHGREIHARHLAELEAYLRHELEDEGRAAGAAAARRLDAFIDLTLGKRRRYVQEPVGFYYPGLPAIEFYDREEFPWLAALEAATPQIRAELAAVLDDPGDALVPYIDYAAGLPLDQWAELNKSSRWSAFHLIAEGAPVETNAARCPETMRALSALPQPRVARRSPAAMFSLLQPRTRIPPHTGVSNTRLVVHLPLVVPDGCGFRVGGEARQWREGEAWVFDDTIEHEAWNDSDLPRAILICDVWSPRIPEAERTLIARLTEAMDAFGAASPQAGL